MTLQVVVLVETGPEAPAAGGGSSEDHGGAPSLERNQAGLWATCTVGDVSVVAVKSDLHPSTDGAQLPIRALWKQMIDQVATQARHYHRNRRRGRRRRR